MSPQRRHRKLPRAAPRSLEMELAENGYTDIAGVDEAGCGALAGPVVAAAVVLPVDHHIKHLTDSKRVPPHYRIELLEQIRAAAITFNAVLFPAHVIDRINIYRARLQAMQRAVEGLDPRPEIVLIDGHVAPPMNIPTRKIVGGDHKCRAIAAASIVAKVSRDRIMERLDVLYPEYGFASHKGYSTADHAEAISNWGPCPIHRLTFAQLLEQQQRAFDFFDVLKDDTPGDERV